MKKLVGSNLIDAPNHRHDEDGHSRHQPKKARGAMADP